LIKIIRRLLSDRGREMHFDIGVVALGAGQPTGHDMVGGAVALRRRHMLERLARGIELAKTERGGCEIELAIEISRLEPGDLRAPGHGLRAVLLLARFRQNMKSREGIMMKPQDLPGRARGAVEILLGQQFRGPLHQARLTPAAVGLRPVSQQSETKTKTQKERSGADGDASRSESDVPAASPLYAALAPDASNVFCHRGSLILASGNDCNCREATGDGRAGAARLRLRVPSVSRSEPPRWPRPLSP
jgi:hypothetical protein